MKSALYHSNSKKSSPLSCCLCHRRVKHWISPFVDYDETHRAHFSCYQDLIGFTEDQRPNSTREFLIMRAFLRGFYHGQADMRNRPPHAVMDADGIPVAWKTSSRSLFELRGLTQKGQK